MRIAIFFVRYPKSLKQEPKYDAPLSTIGFCTNIIEMAGGKDPNYMQGHSFLNYFGNREKDQIDWQKSTY